MLLTTNCSLDEEGPESYPSSFLDSFKVSDINFMMSVSKYLTFLLISRYRHKHEIGVGCEACMFLPLRPLGGAGRSVNPVLGLDLSKGRLGALELAGVSSPFDFAPGHGE